MFPRRAPRLGLLGPLLVSTAVTPTAEASETPATKTPEQDRRALHPKPFVLLAEGGTATVKQHPHIGPGKEFYQTKDGHVQWVERNQHVFLRAQKPASRPPVPPKTPFLAVSPLVSPHSPYGRGAPKKYNGTPYPHAAPAPMAPTSEISLPDLSKLRITDDDDEEGAQKNEDVAPVTLFRASAIGNPDSLPRARQSEQTAVKETQSADREDDGLMSFVSALTHLQPTESNLMSPYAAAAAAAADAQHNHNGSGDADGGAPDKLRPYRLVDLPILDVLGSGGFGIVYKSRLPGTDQEIAVKKFKGGRTFADEKEAFDQELAAFTKIGRHPNCVSLYGYVIEPEHRTIALVLELAKKGSLSAFMSDEQKAAEIRGRRFLPILRQIVEGLVHLHSRELAHRDIKPDNVLVFQTGAKPLVKLSDFGLLREQHRHSTRLRTFAGTPFYSAPEIDWSRRGPRASILPYQQPLKVNYYAADIWALGIMMAEICSAGLVNEDLARLSQAARTSKAALRVVARDLMGHDDNDVSPKPAFVSKLSPKRKAAMASMAKGPAPTPSGRTPAHRLRASAQCPLWVTELIEACLARRPKDRPTAQDVLTILKKHEHDYA